MPHVHDDAIQRPSPIVRRSLLLALALIIAVSSSVLSSAPIVNANAPITSTVTVDRPSIAPGGTVAIDLVVTTAAPVVALVDLEIYDSSRRKVFQTWWDDETLLPGASALHEATWEVPADLPEGTYSVVVGVFAPGWGPLLHWNLGAATVTVQAGGQPPATTSPATTSTPPPAGGTFTEGFADLAAWSVGRSRAGAPDVFGRSTGGVQVPNDVTITAGRLDVKSAVQAYGDLVVRSDVTYDLSNGGVIKLDVTAAAGNNPIQGYPYVSFTEAPYSVPMIWKDNGKGPTPQRGAYIQFRHNCAQADGAAMAWGQPNVMSYTAYAESEVPDTAQCQGSPTRAAGAINRVEIRVDGSTMSIWMTDASSDGVTFGPLKHLWTGPNPLPATGYFSLGVHNHASIKYSDPAAPMMSIDAQFDNVSYPAGATTRSYEVPDSLVAHDGGIDVGWTVPATGRTLTIPAVNPAGTGVLAFNAWGRPEQNPNPTLTYRLNNGPTHSVTPNPSPSGSVLVSVPIDPRELTTGDNTVTISGLGYVSNVDLIMTGGTAGSRPPTTVAVPTTAAPATTAPPAPTTTVRATATTTTAPATTPAPPTATAPPAGVVFAEDFATAAGVNRFDWQLHAGANGGACGVVSNDCATIDATDRAEHDMSCGAPTTHRHIEAQPVHDLLVLDPATSPLMYYCAPGNDSAKGHVMTIVETEGVVSLSFSPKQVFNDIRRMCFDINTNDNMGGGKWINVWIVPTSSLAANGGRFDFADAPALDPEQAVPGPNDWHMKYMDGSLISSSGLDWWAWPRRASEPASRFTQCVEQTAPNQLTYTRSFPADTNGDGVNDPGVAATETQTGPGNLPDGPVRVIFQDGSYNPDKHGGGGGVTWHWDNIQIS